jgi:hypothetical protein
MHTWGMPAHKTLPGTIFAVLACNQRATPPSFILVVAMLLDPGRGIDVAGRVGEAIDLRAGCPSTRGPNVTLQGGGLPMKALLAGTMLALMITAVTAAEVVRRYFP